MTTGGGADNRQEMLVGVFRDKPEMVIDLPEWMLSEKEAESYRTMEALAIVEIAGRDSVAAAVRAVSENGYKNLLPVYAYTGTDIGAWGSVEEAVHRLSWRLPSVRVHPLLVVGSPGFWRAINGRFISDLIAVFGHYTPCTGCHLYLHAIRLPLARRLGNVPVIAGERKSHSGTVKVNQVAGALDFYRHFAETFSVQLALPLADIIEGGAIEEILEMPWKRGEDQLGCCLSGNYKGVGGGLGVDAAGVIRFFNEFAGPAARRIIGEYMENRVPDHEAVAKHAMARCIKGE